MPARGAQDSIMSNYEFRFDEEQGVLYCRADGFFTVEDVRAFGVAMRHHADIARKSRGYCRLLIDSSRGVMQSNEVIEEFARFPPMVERPGDKKAVVVSSNLAKVQARRTFHSDREEAFVTMAAATAWLMQD